MSVSAANRTPDTSDGPLVGVVVLNLHTRTETLACLRSVAASSYRRLVVVLLDNGCADFSVDELAAIVPSSIYLRTEHNLGFAGGANLGTRHALAAGAAYVLFLNSDATIETGAVSELVRTATRDVTIGIVGAKLLQLGAARRLESVGIRVNLRWGRIYQHGFGEIDRGQYDGLDDVSAVSGGAMLLSRAACGHLGGFDERYFSYLEDVDLCLRARRAGVRVVIAPSAGVHHKGKGSSGGRTSARVLYYATRNHLMVMSDHGLGSGGWRRVRTAIVIALNATYAIRGGGRMRLARLRAVWRAWRDFQRGAVGEAPAEVV